MNLERHFIDVSHDTLVNIAVDYASEINALEARIKQLESYLDKTADGKLVRECKKFYCPRCGEALTGDEDLSDDLFRCGSDCPMKIWGDDELEKCYSTPEAARKAREASA